MVDQPYNRCQFVLETKRRAALSQSEPGVFQCFEDAERLIQFQRKARLNRIVIGVLRLGGGSPTLDLW